VGSPSEGCGSHILLPVSRFKEEELISAISEMMKILEWYIFSSSSGIIFVLTSIHLVDLDDLPACYIPPLVGSAQDVCPEFPDTNI
jgi:hypothetical protein